MTARRDTYVAAEGVAVVTARGDTDVAASRCTGVAACMEAGVDRANVTSACCGDT